MTSAQHVAVRVSSSQLLSVFTASASPNFVTSLTPFSAWAAHMDIDPSVPVLSLISWEFNVWSWQGVLGIGPWAVPSALKQPPEPSLFGQSVQ